MREIDKRGPSIEPPAYILCVDDNAFGLSVRKIFLEARGYKVLEAETPEAALIILHEPNW